MHTIGMCLGTARGRVAKRREAQHNPATVCCRFPAQHVSGHAKHAYPLAYCLFLPRRGLPAAVPYRDIVEDFMFLVSCASSRPALAANRAPPVLQTPLFFPSAPLITLLSSRYPASWAERATNGKSPYPPPYAGQPIRTADLTQVTTFGASIALKFPACSRSRH